MSTPDANGCPFRLYVYQLPSRYQRYGSTTTADTIFRTAPLPGSPTGLSTKLLSRHDTDLAAIFHARCLQHRCRTYDARQATLFFVPVFNTAMQSWDDANKLCAEPASAAEGSNVSTAFVALFDRLHAQSAQLQVKGGADHFFINPRVGVTGYETRPVCELDLLDPRLGSAARLAGEQETVANATFGQHHVGTYNTNPVFLSVPWPSWVSVSAAHPAPPWASNHERTTLVAMAMGWSRFANTSLVGRLRRALHQMCGREGIETCTPVERRTREPMREYEGRIAAAYWRATFCLQPAGDSISRKGMVDSLLLGCIPVLFYRGQREMWPWHWGGWVQNATVLLTSRQWDFARQLRAMPLPRIQQMQRTIRRYGHRLTYAPAEVSGGTAALELQAAQQAPATHKGTPWQQPPDAFDLTLLHVHRRSLDHAVVAAGRELQRKQGGWRARAIEGFERLSRVAVEGLCLRSTGSWSDTSCAMAPERQVADWEPPRPLASKAQSADECLARCRGCERCAHVAFSLLGEICAWSPYEACDTRSWTDRGGHARLPINRSRLERRWHYWTFLTLTARSGLGEWVGTDGPASMGGPSAR